MSIFPLKNQIFDYRFPQWCGDFLHFLDRSSSASPVVNDETLKIISEIKKNTVQLETIDKELICSICLEEFNSEKEIAFLDCKHFYHMECIIKWIKKDASCPLCRNNDLV